MLDQACLRVLRRSVCALQLPSMCRRCATASSGGSETAPHAAHLFVKRTPLTQTRSSRRVSTGTCPVSAWLSRCVVRRPHRCPTSSSLDTRWPTVQVSKGVHRFGLPSSSSAFSLAPAAIRLASQVSLRSSPFTAGSGQCHPAGASLLHQQRGPPPRFQVLQHGPWCGCTVSRRSIPPRGRR